MNDYVDNLLIIFGVVIFMFGLLMFCFGKKWFIFRWFFGDRSMFTQIGYGTIIAVVGLVILYVSGAFK